VRHTVAFRRLGGMLIFLGYGRQHLVPLLLPRCMHLLYKPVAQVVM